MENSKLLNIDITTSLEKRGIYAMVCVQINLDQHLVKSIIVEGRKKQIIYEGIESLCFCCGKIRHSKESILDSKNILKLRMVERW